MSKILYTSNFARHGAHPDAVAITAMPPLFNKAMKYCPDLAPSWSLVRAYKDGKINQEQYTVKYQAMLVRRGKSPQQVADSLSEGAILLCYEKPGDFCHRHLAAEWLRQGADVLITELS